MTAKNTTRLSKHNYNTPRKKKGTKTQYDTVDFYEECLRQHNQQCSARDREEFLHRDESAEERYWMGEMD